MSNHLRDNLDSNEILAIVNPDSKVNHFRQNHHVTTVGPHDNVLTLPHGLPCGPKLDEELLLTRRKASLEGSPSARRQQLYEGIHIHLDQIIELVPAVHWYAFR